jgi:hypothetical protein
MRKRDPNLRLEAEITSMLDGEIGADAAAEAYKAIYKTTPLEGALRQAAEDKLEPLRQLVAKAMGDERVALFINYPKGKQGHETRRELRDKVGIKLEPTLIQAATRTRRRIQALFITDYPLKWRRENGVTWSAAKFAARYHLSDYDGDAVLHEAWAEELEQSIESRDRQSRK